MRMDRVLHVRVVHVVGSLEAAVGGWNREVAKEGVVTHLECT